MPKENLYYTHEGDRTGHTVSVAGFRMPRSLRVKLTERLKIVHGELVAQQVEKNVLEGASEQG